jgi:hypothetical protein
MLNTASETHAEVEVEVVEVDDAAVLLLLVIVALRQTNNNKAACFSHLKSQPKELRVLY